MAPPRRIHILYFLLLAACALLLLAFMPRGWTKDSDVSHPVSGYARMHSAAHPAPAEHPSR